VVKRVLPRTPVVIGGPHPSVLSEESAARPEIDIVVRGEGEAIWLELLDQFDRLRTEIAGFDAEQWLEPGTPLHEIFGITFRTTNGKMHVRPTHPPIDNLDLLPWPAYELFKMER